MGQNEHNMFQDFLKIFEIPVVCWHFRLLNIDGRYFFGITTYPLIPENKGLWDSEKINYGVLLILLRHPK